MKSVKSAEYRYFFHHGDHFLSVDWWFVWKERQVQRTQWSEYGNDGQSSGECLPASVHTRDRKEQWFRASIGTRFVAMHRIDQSIWKLHRHVICREFSARTWLFSMSFVFDWISSSLSHLKKKRYNWLFFARNAFRLFVLPHGSKQMRNYSKIATRFSRWVILISSTNRRDNSSAVRATW